MRPDGVPPLAGRNGRRMVATAGTVRELSNRGRPPKRRPHPQGAQSEQEPCPPALVTNDRATTVEIDAAARLETPSLPASSLHTALIPRPTHQPYRRVGLGDSASAVSTTAPDTAGPAVA